MKSLIVTAVVLSSFATQGYADQPDLKSKDANAQGAAREQMPQAGPHRPEVKAQQPAAGNTQHASAAPAAPKRFEQPVGDFTHNERRPSPAVTTSPVQTQAPARAQPRAENRPSVKTSPAAQVPAGPNASIKATPAHTQTQNPAVAQAPGRPVPAIKATPGAAKPNQQTPPAPLAGQHPGKQPTVLQAPGKPGAPGQIGAHQVPPSQQQAGRAQVPGNRPAPPIIAPMPGHAPLVMQHGMVTPAQMQAVQLRNQAFVRQNPRLLNFVETRGQAYRTAYHQQLMTLQTRFLAPAYFAPLRVQYRPWVRVGFYAYAYPVRPMVEFYTYFSNPCVAWFYNEYDAEFYQPYYGQYYTRYPDLNRGYNRVGMYLPTEEFIAMNVALSELQIEAQINYRRSMIYLGNRLSERYRAPIGRHQVIVNHYSMLPSNRAVIVEGFVDNEHNQMPFRALVDLNNADESQLFAVGSWKADEQPTVEQSEDLYDLNDQVVDYGGSLEEPPPPPAS